MPCRSWRPGCRSCTGSGIVSCAGRSLTRFKCTKACESVKVSLAQKSPTVLFRRIPHNAIIITHNKPIGQYIQNKKKKFVYKHKTDCRNSYILPIVFLRKICYSVGAKRKRWFQWPRYSLPCIECVKGEKSRHRRTTCAWQASRFSRLVHRTAVFIYREA